MNHKSNNDMMYKQFIDNPSYENLKMLLRKNRYSDFSDAIFEYLYTKKGKYIGTNDDYIDMLGLLSDDVGEKQVEEERKERKEKSLNSNSHFVNILNNNLI